MTSYRLAYTVAHETKREEFRKYLESTGILDALTKVLVSLYEEQDKPQDGLEYVKNHLNGLPTKSTELQAAKEQLAQANAKIEELTREIDVLKSKLSQYEDGPNPPMS